MAEKNNIIDINTFYKETDKKRTKRIKTSDKKTTKTTKTSDKKTTKTSDKNRTKTNNEEENQSLKYIDLFCGIGGFHQALSKLGGECVLACDIDKNCRRVYKKNYNIEPVPDVKKIDEKNMPDFDVICAGFPCQPFSNGGNKKSFDDERGLLFDEIMRIAKHKKPRFM